MTSNLYPHPGATGTRYGAARTFEAVRVQTQTPIALVSHKAFVPPVKIKRGTEIPAKEKQ